MNFSKISFWGDPNGAGVPKIDLQRLSKIFWKFWYFFQKIQTTLGFLHSILENVDPKISQNRLKWRTKIAENHEISQNVILRWSEWCRGAKNWFTETFENILEILIFFSKNLDHLGLFTQHFGKCKPKNQPK